MAAAATPSNSDLQVVRLDPDPAGPGSDTTLHAFVANGGPDTTASPFTVIVELPYGFTAHGPYFPASCVSWLNNNMVQCAFPAGLPALRTATALIPIHVDPSVPHGTKADWHLEVFSEDHHYESDESTLFTLTVS